jgi:lipopolysaccharide/colanic/teichoic acid biosynthesis glycosyltransferase
MSFEVATKAPVDLSFKHMLDVILALLGILAIAPLLLVVSLLVLVRMGRPVFFVQQRAGLRGREFAMLKFRTMVRDAEARRQELEEHNEMSGPVFKIDDDPRVTPLGRFLRRTSIDELPQLFNVLTGTMSLVGPRPLPVEEQKKIVGWHRRRLSMKPGITCLWQTRGRSDVDFEQWMAYDLEYVDTWSFSLDLKILLLTIPVVLKGRGAK